MSPAPPAAYMFRTSPTRLVPFLGGPDITPGSPATYPPVYGPPGSYRPDATTTGVPDGTVLEPVTTSNTTFSSAQVIDSKEFFGKVSVNGPDVTFRRCIFHGRPNDPLGFMVSCTNAAVQRVRFEDCTFVPVAGSASLNGINGHDYTLLRCDISGVIDPVDPYNTNGKDFESGVYLQQTWIHDFAYYTPDSQHATNDNQTHNDGLQIQGVHGVTIQGCTISAYYGLIGSHQISNLASPTPSGAPNPSLSCILFNATPELGTPSGHVIEDNWLEGAYLPINCGGGGVGNNLGRMWRNKFDGGSYAPPRQLPWTINLRADQMCDTGDGTPNQNTFYDGTPILVRRNG